MDHLDEYANHLGGEPNHAQEALIRTAATLTLLLEVDQARVAAGKDFDEERFLKRVEALRKILNTIGLSRVARTISPKPTGPVVDAHAQSILEASDD